MNVDRRPLVAGNWKMNAGGRNACTLIRSLIEGARELSHVDIVVAPPYTALAAVAHELATAASGVALSAQNMHEEASGAFTGEISAEMLKDAGAEWVILGHSERRHLFGETDEWIKLKVAKAIAIGLRPIVCVGETLEEREESRTLEVVKSQVEAFLDVVLDQAGTFAIAYEPVWAIGTGKVAKPEDAQEVHSMIRSLLEDRSPELALATRILYGGSVKADNAEGLFEQADIDGALVGGASLEAESFIKIASAADRFSASLKDQGPDADPAPEGSTEDPHP